jgi:hypothetical protein
VYRTSATTVTTTSAVLPLPCPCLLSEGRELMERTSRNREELGNWLMSNAATWITDASSYQSRPGLEYGIRRSSAKAHVAVHGSAAEEKTPLSKAHHFLEKEVPIKCSIHDSFCSTYKVFKMFVARCETSRAIGPI